MEWWQILLIVIASIALLLFLSTILYTQIFKRFYDIVISGIAIIVLSPLYLILIIIGAITMHGNPFFLQSRPGKIDKKTGKEQIFRLVKFRSMSNKRDKDGNFLPDDQRINKYGKFLRVTSLDELPELFNIFIGNISIVGPRPHLVLDMVSMSDDQRKRHSVTPGLTGLAQVNGRNAILWEDIYAIDLEYIKKVTFWGDIKIIFKTVLKVLKRNGIDRQIDIAEQNYGYWQYTQNRITMDEYLALKAEAERLIK